MPRADLSKYLVHWTKGATEEEAFDSLRSIVSQEKIFGYGDAIRGQYPCVCFTETPSDAFHKVINRYKPFGIEISKSWLFDQGGRPVIYQTEDEFSLLPAEIQWRHMRYEPNGVVPIDFTWEREWRINTECLELDPEYTRIIVPDEIWAEFLEADFESEELENNYMLTTVFGEEWLMAPIEEFRYRYTVINV